ncbi:hypothetical protein MBM_08432 [Drepanopeziza brunnea f. sp. 'multigermtubi' MB_m1]|uniref:Uncharacterized protein n=1 Tax=Marssonina brunnea f. sp. multigermtubi (strain MB_m1) TaxID=1072389 RepID=K1XLK1_MARBU|nr:uncharacterized protein MBM_08432 [Drepanopeziza brunnea f. sp. 'multigermtubi' MB_m1]EKD13349.1 hypothetical protein MBM_08432 [Drepanopeziza brunnea f. sp. 'multigermtubi' MB_m1]
MSTVIFKVMPSGKQYLCDKNNARYASPVLDRILHGAGAEHQMNIETTSEAVELLIQWIEQHERPFFDRLILPYFAYIDCQREPQEYARYPAEYNTRKFVECRNNIRSLIGVWYLAANLEITPLMSTALVLIDTIITMYGFAGWGYVASEINWETGNGMAYFFLGLWAWRLQTSHGEVSQCLETLPKKVRDSVEALVESWASIRYEGQRPNPKDEIYQITGTIDDQPSEDSQPIDGQPTVLD